MSNNEDISYLEEWICKIRNNFAKAKIVLDNCKLDKSFFTIGTTAKPTNHLRPYTTPIRRISNGVISGVVVFTRTQAVIAAKIASAYTDRIVVDAESKFHNENGVSSEILKRLTNSEPINENSGRDLQSLCLTYLKNIRCYLYKSNDMTVEGIWQFLALRFDCLTGVSCSIVGGGNIGFKLAVKLVESGCRVNFVRRNPEKGKSLVAAVNMIKHKSATGEAVYYSDSDLASQGCDVVIGCTDGIPAVSCKAVESMKRHGILIDVGKGSISKEGLSLAHANEVDVLRFDVTCALDGMIATIVANEKTAKRTGKKTFKGSISLVSGGVLGAEGDIVVDDYRSPFQVFGVCDGMGDFKQNLSLDDQDILKSVKHKFEIDPTEC